jgi:phage shock protein C
MSASLSRPRRGKIIAGVCAGLARRFGLPKFLVRLFFVIFAFVGIGEIVYIVLWILMPKDPST